MQIRLRQLVSALTGLYLMILLIYVILRGLFGDRFWWLSLLNTFAYVLLLPLVILLPLTVVTRARQTALRLLPVLVAGGIWLAPYYVPKSSPAPSGVTLKVLSANVWGNNHNLSAVETWIRGVDADIVLLQEISPAYSQEHMPDLMDAYPYQASQVDDTRWGNNTTLSRYPMLEIEEIDLGMADEMHLVRTVLDVEGQPVAVYNVHLVWPGGNPRLSLPVNNLYLNILLGFNDSVRNRQVKNLLRHLQDEPYPYIVAGDFNTSDHTATYQQMAAQMRDSFIEAGSGQGKSWPVSISRGLPGLIPPLVRIDYIWHSADIQAVQAEVGPNIGSDHLPLFATLEINPR